ncbi:MAG: hypothetical protein U0P30_01720 [Vicinamibacterales bacterium]
MATKRKPAPTGTRTLAVKKEALVDLSVKQAGPKGGYDTWKVGGLTSTMCNLVKVK